MFYKLHGVRALIRHSNKLLVLKRADSDKSDANLWDVPGGKIEAEETAFAAVKREIYEETGIGADMLKIQDLHGFILEEFNSNHKLIIGAFDCQSQTNKVKLNREHSEYAWVVPSKFKMQNMGRVLNACLKDNPLR